MNALVTGGAGFIGRWVVKALLDKKINVFALDNLSNGRKENLDEFKENENFKGLIVGDIKNKKILSEIFKNKIDVCLHLAASINIHDSIVDPEATVQNNVFGTLNVLEEARKSKTKVVFMSSAHVYSEAKGRAIDEEHPTKASSPYSASKIAGENLASSYWNAYGLPVAIVRPFTAYGPYQKGNSEGGVTSIFTQRCIEGKKLEVYGNGSQTRDLFYVEDCADFIVRAALSEKANGEIFNAGSGKDISMKELALFICKDSGKLAFAKHPHPQSEVGKMVCDYSKAKRILGWEPTTSLEKGLELTKEWLKQSK
ncbi:MAG: SDR family NAD(P)-dependent oxidoreductase [Candidatus Woesearchaeota archaeon]|nr:SDR family NAD(P)-dependent oxidoreductase [Candidatus Woesearchaeota archaeon]